MCGNAFCKIMVRINYVFNEEIGKNIKLIKNQYLVFSAPGSMSILVLVKALNMIYLSTSEAMFPQLF